MWRIHPSITLQFIRQSLNFDYSEHTDHGDSARDGTLTVSLGHAFDVAFPLGYHIRLVRRQGTLTFYVVDEPAVGSVRARCQLVPIQS